MASGLVRSGWWICAKVGSLKRVRKGPVLGDSAYNSHTHAVERERDGGRERERERGRMVNGEKAQLLRAPQRRSRRLIYEDAMVLGSMMLLDMARRSFLPAPACEPSTQSTQGHKVSRGRRRASADAG